MKAFKRTLGLLLCLALLAALAPAALAEGDPAGAYRIRVLADNRETPVRVLQDSYADNLYLSLADLSAALQGSSAAFRFDRDPSDGDIFRVTTGASAVANASGQASRSPSAPVSLSLARNRLYVDKTERRYYTYRYGTDLYMSLADVQLMLDISADLLPDGGLRLYPDEPFAPDLSVLEKTGYFECFNGVVLGDADTGEILFYNQSRRAVPIASTSKLMSYLLIAEAEERGEISWDDKVGISAAAAQLSRSADGMVPLTAGAELPLRELLEAMLLASSNECAEALAEHVAGSTEDFVERMNARAKELGLSTAEFYTPHGLPQYTRGVLPAKLQNRMSARDLFKLSAYLLEHFPELTDITAKQLTSLPALHYDTANSNPLVFNLPGVNGLKTGSTNRAGYCLVASLPVTVGEQTHTIVAVVLGAETAPLRGQCAEMLLRHAKAYYESVGFAPEQAA